MPSKRRPSANCACRQQSIHDRADAHGKTKSLSARNRRRSRAIPVRPYAARPVALSRSQGPVPWRLCQVCRGNDHAKFCRSSRCFDDRHPMRGVLLVMSGDPAGEISHHAAESGSLCPGLATGLRWREALQARKACLDEYIPTCARAIKSEQSNSIHLGTDRLRWRQARGKSGQGDTHGSAGTI